MPQHADGKTKVQWFLEDECIEWLKELRKITGIRPSLFIERIIRYEAGVLSDAEELAFEEAINVARSYVEIDWKESRI